MEKLKREDVGTCPERIFSRQAPTGSDFLKAAIGGEEFDVYVDFRRQKSPHLTLPNFQTFTFSSLSDARTVLSHPLAQSDGDVSVSRLLLKSFGASVSQPVSEPLGQRSVPEKNGSLAIHRYLLVPTALSAQPLVHHICSTCWEVSLLAVSDRSKLPPPGTAKWTVLASPSESPIEPAKDSAPLFPKHHGNFIAVPSCLLALSKGVAPPIILGESLCSLFFLLDWLPFNSLDTRTLHSSQFNNTFTLQQYSHSLYSLCTTTTLKPEPIRIR